MSRNDEAWRLVKESLAVAEPDLSRNEGFMESMRLYVCELVRWGLPIHLTGRNRPAENIAEQVRDSLAMLRCAEGAMQDAGGEGAVRVVDVGAGSGFPGIVWKLARPDWELTLFERREKLAGFLERTVAVLGLESVEVIEGDARTGDRHRYDIVVSKAAGRFPAILPIAWRLGKPGGLYVTAKGDRWEQELEQASPYVHAGVVVVPMEAGRGFAIALLLPAPR